MSIYNPIVPRLEWRGRWLSFMPARKRRGEKTAESKSKKGDREGHGGAIAQRRRPADDRL
jgi:hypothetical protein